MRLVRLDWPLLVGLLALIALGLVVSYSAAGQSELVLRNQLIRVAVGLGVLLVVSQTTPPLLLRWAPALYVGTVALLVVVELLGVVGQGAQRWLDLGVVRFQPSELAKITVPMMLAWYLSDKALPVDLRSTLIALALLVVPVALIMVQPDLGTSLLVAGAALAVVFLSGVPWRWLLISAGGVLATAPLAWSLMEDYQRGRVMTLLDPERDPLGSGYHIIQSKIAVGSGGLYGKGWLEGSQSQLDFIPESSTDFIFAVYAEEFGLVGNLLLIGLYALLLWRGLHISMNAHESFSRLLGGSLVFSFAVYVIVNIGMVTGVLPVVGVPLPLVSYGGTSMVTLLLAFGILMAIRQHRKLLPA